MALPTTTTESVTDRWGRLPRHANEIVLDAQAQRLQPKLVSVQRIELAND